MKPKTFYRYSDASIAALNDTNSRTLIIFWPTKKMYLRFEGPDFLACVNSYLDYKHEEFDAKGIVPDFQEVVAATDWHRITFDLDYDIEPSDPAGSSREAYDEAVAWFRGGVEEIIMAACDAYFDMFESVISPGNFIVCESLDPREPLRLSTHITIKRAVPDYRIAAHFVDLVIGAIPEEFRCIVDRSFYRTVHNLRITGCAKSGSLRIKIPPSDVTVAETFVSAPCSHVPAGMVEKWMGDLVRATNRPMNIAASPPNHLVEQACAIAAEKYSPGGVPAFQFYRLVGSLVTFRRLRPCFCEICQRVHEHDNSLVFRINYVPGMTQIYEMCRRDEEGKTISRGIITTANEVERTIAGASSSSSTQVTSPPQGYGSVPIPMMTYSEPIMQDYPPEPRTLFVRAPMKLGKTKALRKFVTAHVSDSQSKIIFVSFRRTFSASTMQRFPEFVLYSDIKGSLDAQKMIVQVESLHRIAPDKIGRVDLLILDESESIIDQFDSGLSADRNGDFAVFQWLLRTARRCIALDAFMSERSYTLITRIRGLNGALLINNIYRNAVEDTYYITSSREQWLLALLECVSRDEKIVICANSATEGRTLYALLQRKLNEGLDEGADSAPRIKFYCAETPSRTKAADFANVDDAWTDCEILIYTPTLTAGVSFEREHFDRLFGYFTDKSCSAQTCIQMMGRIRNIALRQSFICVSSEVGALPETREDMILWLRIKKQAIFANDLMIEYTDDGLPTIQDTDYAELRVQNAIARNRSRNNFLRELVRMVIETGARCVTLTINSHSDVFGTRPTFDDLRRVHDEHNDAGSQVSHQQAEAIATSRELTGDEYKKICDVIAAPQGLDNVPDTDRHAAKKFELRATYRVHDTDLSAEFVATFMKPDIIQTFRNLHLLCDYYARNNRDMVAALAEMRRVEAAHMRVGARPPPASGEASTSQRHAESMQRETELIPTTEIETHEFDFNYVYEVHRLAHIATTYIGFAHVLDTNMCSMREIELRLGQISNSINRLIPLLTYQFKVPIPKGGAVGSQLFIEMVNSILKQTYGISLVRVGTLYQLALTSLFRVRTDGQLVLA